MAGLGLVRRLPTPLRRVVIQGVGWLRGVLEQRATDEAVNSANLRLLAKLPRRSGRRHVGRRVVVAGLFGARCGLQRGADLMVLDLRANGVEVLAFDFTAALDVTVNIGTTATSDVARVLAWQPTDLIIHMNPPLFARVLALFPTAFLSATTVIGYWVWELTVVPSTWGECARFVDEIWTPSPFVAEAIAAGVADLPGAVRVVPHAVDRDPMRALPERERTVLRAGFGLGEDCFVVGTSFSFESNYARKNPCAAIEAFRLAFRGGEQARLIIRCNDTRKFARLFDHLVSFAGDDPRILIWDTGRVPCAIRQFYGLIDLYISLHRSEGYGLNMAEAAQAGVRVLATDWGLAPDIAQRPELRTVGSRLVVPLDSQRFYESFPGGLWAEPDLSDAASALAEAHAGWLDRSPVQTGRPQGRGTSSATVVAAGS